MTCPYCHGTREMVTDHPVFGPEVMPCPDCQDKDDICTNCGRAAHLHPILSEEGDCYDPK